MTPYVKRPSISVTEEREENGHDPILGEIILLTTWTAILYGPLSTGEHVDMARTGPTFATALQNLEQAIAELGWEIR